MIDNNQSVVPTCITIQGIIQLLSILKKNNKEIEALFKIDDLEKNIKSIKQIEKSILEIKVKTEVKKEKVIQIKIQMYD